MCLLNKWIFLSLWNFFFTELERQLTGLTQTTTTFCLSVETGVSAALGNFISTNLVTEKLARPGTVLTFFHGIITFCLCKQNFIFMSGPHSTIQKIVLLSCHVVSLQGFNACRVPPHCAWCWQWVSCSLGGRVATWGDGEGKGKILGWCSGGGDHVWLRLGRGRLCWRVGACPRHSVPV